MGVAKRRGAVLETQRGCPRPKGTLCEDRAFNSTNTITAARVAPRSDTWTRRARVFVCAAPEAMASHLWPRTRETLRKRLPGTELVTAGGRSSCNGVVIAPLVADTGTVGDQADIALALGMPVIVLTRHGLATGEEFLVDPHVYFARRRDSPVFVSALTAMGALPLRR